VQQDEYAIRIANLTKVFTRGTGTINKMRKKPPRHNVAVDDVSLDIKEHELFGLLGPNGAGKTSIIKMLSTLLIPDSGTATVNGWDILKEPFNVRMSIGLTLSSERQLYWKLSARENLEYFASLYLIHHKEIPARVDSVLSLMQLADQQDMLVENFSSGNKQKVALARALLNDPPILFLDEPTIGLDPSFSQSFRTLIKSTINKKEKKTILLTTHYMDEADQLCDRIAFIDRGQIVALGTPRELKRSIDEKEIITLVLSNMTQDLVGQVQALEGVSSVEPCERDTHPMLKVYTDSASGCMQEIIGIVTANSSQVLSFSTSKPTLEDVFIKITGSGLDG
jgi:ABC-2 type transport system ATP-binding protein